MDRAEDGQDGAVPHSGGASHLLQVRLGSVQGKHAAVLGVPAERGGRLNGCVGILNIGDEA